MPLRGGWAYQGVPGVLSLFNIMLNLMLSHALSMHYLCTIHPPPTPHPPPAHPPSTPRPRPVPPPPIPPSISRPPPVHSPSIPRLCLGYKAIQKKCYVISEELGINHSLFAPAGGAIIMVNASGRQFPPCPPLPLRH